MSDESPKLNIEELSAFLDGELPEPRASEVARLVEVDPHWARAWDEIRAVDTALDQWRTPPVPDGLAERIVAASRRQPATSAHRWRLWAGVSSAAAAAIILAAVLIVSHDRTQPAVVARDQQAASAEIREGDEKLIVENLDFFRNYEVVENYETLQAIERLEQAGYGT